MKRTTEDKLVHLLKEASPFAQFVVTLPERRVVEPNARFLNYMDYGTADFADESIRIDDLVDAESLKAFSKPIADTETLRQVVRFRTRSGEEREGEVSIAPGSLDGEALLLCHVRDLADQRAREKKRREEASRYRKKNIEIARANLLLYELTERVSTTYDLTASLLHSRNLNDLTKKALAVLTDKQGLNALEAAFVIRDGDGFKVRTSSGKRLARPVLTECEEAMGSLEQEEIILDPQRGVLFLPLFSRGKIHGVLWVRADAESSPVFAAPHEVIRIGALDIFKTLTGMVSLLIDNLRLNQDLELKSIVDPLTGAYNRRYFDRKARTEVKRATRYDEALSFLLVDIDNLKEINDRHGHQAGDRVLMDITALLKANCREEDAVCRYGGDEFLIILVETALKGAMQKAESLRQLVETTLFRIPGRPRENIRITISCGVATRNGKTDNEHKLFQAVDKALYRAKREKNTVAK